MGGNGYRKAILAVVMVYVLICGVWFMAYVSGEIRLGQRGVLVTNQKKARINMTTRRLQALNLSGLVIAEKINPFAHALVYGKRRSYKGYMTIGIPTMLRPMGQVYLWGTLDSLFTNMKEEDKNETVVVIMLSDFEDNLRQKLGQEILDKYRRYVNSGLIHIIQAPLEYYPPLNKLSVTYNHPMARVKWRAKQNIDYAFMMTYSANISHYYLQLEDDVRTVPAFVNKIKASVQKQAKRAWICLEYSELGYIGKLYHSSHLKKLANLLTLFYNEQPNDVTLRHFNRLMLQNIRHLIKPTLFQHQGYHSSLTIKKMKIQDRFFVEPTLPANGTETTHSS